jgi:hypothetical protein
MGASERLRQIKQSIQAGLIVLCGTAAASTASAVVINHNYSDAPKEELVLEILKLVLANDPEGHQYDYRPLNENVDEGRMVQMVKDGQLDVMWAGLQESYERELIPIRIPIFKGLLGHRIFIIREGDQARFNHIETLDDLKAIPGGQGRFWGDTEIMKNSGLKVVTAVKYQGLFHMLDGSRFDYFPRAAHEPWSEIPTYPDLKLTVEKNILLVYPFFMYFFVAKDRPDMAAAIERGFLAALENGSYNQLFFNSPIIKEALQRSQLQNRKVLRIPNPFISPEAVADQERFLLNLEEIGSYL